MKDLRQVLTHLKGSAEVQPVRQPDFGDSVEEIFEQFKAGMTSVVRPSDIDTHLDLAIAYRVMGLIDDALRATGTALRHSPHHLRAGEAVATLLSERHLRHSLDATLALLRGALFLN